MLRWHAAIVFPGLQISLAAPLPIFSLAVFRVAPQLTEHLKEAKTTTKRTNEVLFLGEEEGEGFIGDWVKKYGILGIPFVLAIILITVIVCISGSKERK